MWRQVRAFWPILALLLLAAAQTAPAQSRLLVVYTQPEPAVPEGLILRFDDHDSLPWKLAARPAWDPEVQRLLKAWKRRKLRPMALDRREPVPFEAAPEGYRKALGKRQPRSLAELDLSQALPALGLARLESLVNTDSGLVWAYEHWVVVLHDLHQPSQPPLWLRLTEAEMQPLLQTWPVLARAEANLPVPLGAVFQQRLLSYAAHGSAHLDTLGLSAVLQRTVLRQRQVRDSLWAGTREKSLTWAVPLTPGAEDSLAWARWGPPNAHQQEQLARVALALWQTQLRQRPPTWLLEVDADPNLALRLPPDRVLNLLKNMGMDVGRDDGRLPPQVTHLHLRGRLHWQQGQAVLDVQWLSLGLETRPGLRIGLGEVASPVLQKHFGALAPLKQPLPLQGLPGYPVRINSSSVPKLFVAMRLARQLLPPGAPGLAPEHRWWNEDLNAAP